ncbi:cell division cycle 42 [Ascoidea rubescens DSM 1968]|uniref:Cell division cycle 42 n=1 Tax=Ascoidea rubescens DSM 1968 TaxID=1344418 RepID=A0A1D2VM98_9ASCO|nr:cell division cycle 42 [Ascoidea rubescens DSM 1968]XP_020049036.1 cell division cycle 42 [Ascoidea rubescens DSM 1968]ODV62710.1 cell division cycle 42 [Ascoidea rubescens DSM 1968]ODV62729.1 cell division cycle 42 [Ascoidea rubescens DSM 1968]
MSNKLVMVGESACGKTCLIRRYLENNYNDKEGTTASFYKKEHSTTIDGITHSFDLWDTGGQEDYDNLRKLSYADAKAFLVCYSVDQPQELESVLLKWMSEVREHCPKTPIVLVACKTDLRKSAQRRSELRANGYSMVTTAKGDELARKFKLREFCVERFYETSSLTGKGVDQLFEETFRMIVTKENTKFRERYGCCSII